MLFHIFWAKLVIPYQRLIVNIVNLVLTNWCLIGHIVVIISKMHFLNYPRILVERESKFFQIFFPPTSVMLFRNHFRRAGIENFSNFLPSNFSNTFYKSYLNLNWERLSAACGWGKRRRLTLDATLRIIRHGFDSCIYSIKRYENSQNFVCVEGFLVLEHHISVS